MNYQPWEFILCLNNFIKMYKYASFISIIFLSLLNIPVGNATTNIDLYGNQSLTPLIESDTEYIPLPGSVRLEIDNGKDTYFSTDHLGSTRVEISADNSAQGQVEYTPFGENEVTGNVSTSRQYTGQEFENETQTYNYHARQFDASTGRFVSVDRGRYNNSPYVYANNNPVNFLDLTGNAPTSLVLSSNGSHALFAKFIELAGATTRFLQKNFSSSQPPVNDFNGHIFVTNRGTDEFIDVEGVLMGSTTFAAYLDRYLQALHIESVELKSIFFSKAAYQRNDSQQPSFAERFMKVASHFFPNLETTYSVNGTLSIVVGEILSIRRQYGNQILNIIPVDSQIPYISGDIKPLVTPIPYITGDIKPEMTSLNRDPKPVILLRDGEHAPKFFWEGHPQYEGMLRSINEQNIHPFIRSIYRDRPRRMQRHIPRLESIEEELSPLHLVL